MPDDKRPCKKTRQALRALHARHQEHSSSFMMAAATMMAQAARTMRPMDDATMTAIALDAEGDSSPTALEDGPHAVPGVPSIGDLMTRTQGQSGRSIFNTARGTVPKKEATQGQSHKGRSRSRHRDDVRPALPRRQKPLRESCPPRKSDQDGEESATSASKATPVAALVLTPKSQAAFNVVANSKRQVKREVRAQYDEKSKKTAKPTKVDDEDSYTSEGSEECIWHGQGNIVSTAKKVHTDNMTKIQTFKDAEVFLQHLGDVCFWQEQAKAFVQLKDNIKRGFESSLVLFHNNCKNHNLRSAYFICKHCEEAVALDYCKEKKASEKAAYTANILDLLKFFNVIPDKGTSV